VSPSAGSASQIKSSIVEFIVGNNINVNKLVAIGCDGTNVNTGQHNGVIRLLEVEFNKPLQWLICQLHANELPLRHLVNHLDGPTSGPRAFSGPIGKGLLKCEQLPVVCFDKIESDFPTVTSTDLSTDQQYLWDISKAIVRDHCSLDLSKKSSWNAEPLAVVDNRKQNFEIVHWQLQTISRTSNAGDVCVESLCPDMVCDKDGVVM
jgi:hypothetical protein